MPKDCTESIFWCLIEKAVLNLLVLKDSAEAILFWLIFLLVLNLFAVDTFSAETRTIVFRILVSLWAYDTTWADAIPELSKFKICVEAPLEV